MDDLTPTQFRTNLYRTLEKVIYGFKVRIQTQRGTVILISENDFEKITSPKSKNLMEPKAEGRIIGSLDDADEKLRQYLRMAE